jgi:RNA-binding protein
MTAPLTSARRSELRAEAHSLTPIVIIGDKGLTDALVAEIDRSLRAHELIKVRASSGDRAQRDIWMEAICDRLQAHPVQQIGKVFVLYRKNPEEAKPKRAPAPPSPKDGARGVVVTERGKQAQRARDAAKQRERDIVEMKRKGKIPADARIGPPPKFGSRALPDPAAADVDERRSRPTGTSRPRSRTPAPLPESGPRRRRPRTSR